MLLLRLACLQSVLLLRYPTQRHHQHLLLHQRHCHGTCLAKLVSTILRPRLHALPALEERRQLLATLRARLVPQARTLILQEA